MSSDIHSDDRSDGGGLFSVEPHAQAILDFDTHDGVHRWVEVSIVGPSASTRIRLTPTNAKMLAATLNCAADVALTMAHERKR